MHTIGRVAHLVASIRTCPYDPRTVRMWANYCAISESALRARCRIVQTPAKAALDVGRLLRAISLARKTGCRAIDVLDIIDDRTLRRLDKTCGSASLRLIPNETVFLESQALVTNAALVRELKEQIPTGRNGELSW